MGGTRESHHHDTTTSTVGSKRAKVKKRVITAARKEQNRAAQKAFRERQKQQQKLSKTETIYPWPRQLQPRPDDMRDVSLVTSSSESYGPTPGTSTSAGSDSDVACSSISNDPSGPELANLQQIPDIGSSSFGDALNIDFQSSVDQFDCSFDHTANPPPTGTESTQPTTAGETDSVPPAIMDILFNSTRRGSETSQGNVFLPPPANVLSSISRDIEDNRTQIFRACMANAICIGINLSELMVCTTPCQSPFYRPLASPHDDPQALIASASPANLPEPLKPTLAQILIPHHASFDLIPIPRLRERAILMCAALPHLFSIWEMKIDIYVQNALTCQRRSTASGFVSQPWDMHAWRASPWFLSKWKMIIDEDTMTAGPTNIGIPGIWM
ncbi:hypothetical protein GGR57DRAFT_438116 [Xylariaceae sp. FL1272]|nr:hypothetical protein GGR57DRAFT_438116 [Xylariaceae sp. FL1272]